MVRSINKITSVTDMKDLIGSLTSTSANLHKLLPVKINGHIVMSLIDSGNSFYNALSQSVAKRIGLVDYQPYKGSPVGTASIGSSINVVGIVPTINFRLTDETGKEHSLPSRLMIVKHLSCGLNISLPFLVEHGLDQMHSQGILLNASKDLRFPLYRNVQHARKRLKKKNQGEPQINVITLGERIVDVSSKARQTIPPRTGRLLPVQIDEISIEEPTDSVFSFKDTFLK